jgi:hypothetical protein
MNGEGPERGPLYASVDLREGWPCDSPPGGKDAR